MLDTDKLTERYVAIWNEPDRASRRALVEELWARDATHILQPPEDIKQSAAAVGMTPVLEIVGHDAIEIRVRRSHEQFVAPGSYVFRRRDNVERLRNLVKFSWEMVGVEDGTVAGVGLELLFLDDDGRIQTDYQFIEP